MASSGGSASLWEVVGGGDKGGIVVRVGKDVASAMAPERLSTGAVLKELELDGERLHYERLAGSGPASGWVSLRLQSGKELVSRAAGVWEVVGGEDKGGILVRTGKDKSSAEAPGRLSCGALVRELQLEDERMQYQRLTGTGPERGWVSTKLAAGKDLVVRVGADSAVADTPVAKLIAMMKDHHDSSWNLCPSMAAQLNAEDRAAAVPELSRLALDGDSRSVPETRSCQRKALRLLAGLGEAGPLARLLTAADLGARCEAALRLVELGGDACTPHIDQISGLLSDKEWRGRCWGARVLGKLGKAATPATAALRKALEDPDADVREAAAEALRGLGEAVAGYKEDPHPQQVLRRAAPESSRKPRILVLHGTPSNSSVMQMQAAKLKATLGKDFEWKFVDSPMGWQAIPGSRDPLYTEPSDLEKQLAKGKPFLWWYVHGNAVYDRVDEGVENMKRLVEEARPVDAVVSFSQGSNCVSLLLDAYRREGKEVPWLLSVFFCGGQIDDEVYRFKDGWRSSQPTVRVYNDMDDAWFGGSEISLDFMYSDLVELGHKDGHAFPSSPPRAAEIYTQVAQEIRRRVGLST